MVLLERRRTVPGAVSLAVVVGSGCAIATSGVAVPKFLGGLPGWTSALLDDAWLHLTAAQFYIVLGVMSAAYLGVLAFRPPLRWIVVAVVALHVAFLLAPPMLSGDVFSYIGYARLGAVHHLDPYVSTPAAARQDPVFRYIHWRHTRSAYGPLFTLGSYPLGRLELADALAAFKLVAAVSSLGCVALVGWIAGRLGRPRAAAVAAFGLNPLLLAWTIGGAHNDLLMMLLMLAGVALAVAAREAAGGAMLAAAVAVKASAGLAIPFLVLGSKRRLRAAAGATAGAAAVVALAMVAFPDHAAGMIAVLHREQFMVARDSVPREAALALGLGHVTSGMRLACQVLLGGALLTLAVRVWRGADWLRACGWAFVVLVVTSTWFLAWYTVWPLPFAAITRDRRLLAATLVLQGYYVANHVPFL